MSFTGKDLPSSGRIYLFLFPESLDYLVQMFYDYLSARPGCPDFNDPSVLDLNSANVNTSLLLLYESLFYSKPSEEDRSKVLLIGSIQKEVTIPYSTKWSAYLTHCSANAGGKVQVDGFYETLNPFGSLDADQYPMMLAHLWTIVPSTCIVAVLYLALVLYYRHFNLHRRQVSLWLLLCTFIISNCMFSATLLVANKTGLRPAKWVLAGNALAYTVPLAYARFLLFSFAFGCRIITLRSSVVQNVLAIVYALLYALLVTLQKYFELLKDPSVQILPFIVNVLLPVFNYTYFVWINFTLNRSLEIATTSRIEFKIRFYQRLLTILHTCTVLLTVLGACKLFVTDVHTGNLWVIAWLFDYYIYLVYIGATFTVCFLFRPRRSNQIYYYSEAPAANEAEAPQNPRIQVSALESDFPSLRKTSKTLQTLDPLKDQVPPRRAKRTRKREEDLSTAAQRTLLLSSHTD